MQVVCDTLCVRHNLLWRTVCHWYFPASLTSTAVSLPLLKEIKRRDNVLEILTSFKFPADSRLFCGSEVAFLSSSCQFKVNPWNDLELRAGAKRSLQCIVLMSMKLCSISRQCDALYSCRVSVEGGYYSWFTRDCHLPLQEAVFRPILGFFLLNSQEFFGIKIAKSRGFRYSSFKVNSPVNLKRV